MPFSIRPSRSFAAALAFLFSIPSLVIPTWADYEAGLQAFQRADYATALREWRPLAEQGHVSAQYYLGLLYDFSKGIPQDFAMARQWYEKAAAQGHGGAQNNLGGLYEFGHGVTRDDVLAYMWYHLAATHPAGDEWRDFAAENRDGIAEHMTSAQIAEAKKRAREWKPKHP
jgi:TPR repeat protein